MAFTPEFLDELKTRAGIADVIGKRVRLQKKGRGEYQGLCPFHKEKTPSFTVNEDKGFYHCFGCQVHGSVFDFVMETEGLNFPEAVERLATDVGMEVPRDTPEEQQRQQRRKTLEEVTEAAAVFFERQLAMPEGRQALDYLEKRGLSAETRKKFRLGFAPDGRGALKAALSRDGIPEDLMIESGMLIQPDGQDRQSYDRFRGRVMFPIADRRGRVVAFGGRILGDGEPKYLNSPETPLFQKRRTLYGLNHALAAARRAGTLIVTEGYMDVIALAEAGLDHAVAPLGTALTEEQLTELWRAVPEPVLCFDGDAAGQRAASKAAERALPLIRAGLGLRFATLPAGEDPDSLVRGRGLPAVQTLLDEAQPLSEVIWRMETGNRLPRTPEDRAALQKRFSERARDIGDATFRRHFIEHFRRRLHPEGGDDNARGGGRNNKKQAWRRSYRTSGPAIDTKRETTSDDSPDERRQKVLLATLINHPGLFDTVEDRLGNVEFSAVPLDNLRQEVLKTLAGEEGLDSASLINHLNQGGHADMLNGVLHPSVLAHAFFARPDADMEDSRRGWDEAFEQLRGRDLQSEIRDAERAWVENPTDEAFHRLKALKAEQHNGASTGAD